MIKGDTKVHSLYGSPVAHSLSPVIFNTIFQKLSLNRAYVPFEVSRENLKQAVEAARTLGFDGFNITMPHKTAVLEMLDRVDKNAEESGAVNTVATTKSGLVGYNTDGEGAIRAIRSYGFEPNNKRILVLGAGGAALALVHRLSSENNNIRILNRTLDKARLIANNATGIGRVSCEELTKSNLEQGMENADLLVNTTPIRTSTLVSRLKIPINTIKDTGWIFDLAYDQPAEPVPIGRGTISPLEMLLHQAALSYEIWLNETAPFDLMRSSLADYLGKDWR
ncbi:shikimate dehydrogenase [Candidatus Bathyarchaeota archaeon]|nr:MAG: shikimate dehydrogenase [Candidatus Bathyarchaeota archaeon]TMI54758.1 MAG: shikimate dehydrogenase [Candidatus Bathyarchaeota archaeon]